MLDIDNVNGLVISLTSYGERLKTVDNVIASLKRQTKQADKIILWLDENETDLESLPESLKALCDHQFEIGFCPNYKSYKKLIPTLLKYPNSNIITFDDDILIPENTVAEFLQAHLEFPNAVIAARGRMMLKNEEGELAPYSQWRLLTNKHPINAKDCILPIGYGGVLYPQGSLHQSVVKHDQFMTCADNADDIWFKAMSLLNRTETVILPQYVSENYKILDNTQENALYLNVNTENRNLECFQAISEIYPELNKLIDSSSFDLMSLHNQDLEEPLSTPKLFDTKNQAIEFFRDIAINIEKSHPQAALRLMTLARRLRPKGPMINQKIKQYKKALNR